MEKLGGIKLGGAFGGYDIVNKPCDKLPQDVASAVASVNGGLLGATFSPIWYIGKQTVNGVNHFFIAEEIRVTKTQDAHIVGLVINIPPGEGAAKGEGAKVVRIIEEAELPEEAQAKGTSRFYKYYLDHRPYDIGTVPKEGLFFVDSEDKGGNFGAAYYEKQLPASVAASYELRPDVHYFANKALHITVYHPTEEILSLLRKAVSESGFYIWQTPQIARIKKYESYLNEARQLLCAGENSDRLKYLVSELEAYYESVKWRKDFENDEAGLLPKNLKRGVLSEDGIYNLLEEYREVSE